MDSAFSCFSEQPFFYLTVDPEQPSDPKDVYFTRTKLPPVKTRAIVKRLGIQWDVRAKSLPEEIADFPAIEYLAIPGALAHTLESRMVPRTLRTLRITGDETSKEALHPKLALPQLDFLAGFSKLAFRAAQLPNLTRIEVKLASAKMPAELAALPLQALGVGPLANAAGLEPFAKLPLTALSLRRGTAASLAGVEMFPNLVELNVKGMDRLTDLGPIAKLPKLRAVTVEWCARLAKVDALAQLPELRSLNMWSSKVPPRAWSKLAVALAKRKVAIQWPPQNIGE
jgi:hypothetical protein